MILLHVLLVGVGGFIGSIARFWIANELNKHLLGTWVANVSGSLLLAIVVRLYMNGLIEEPMWLFFGVGFCGAYTTFSTFGKETLELIFIKKYSLAIQYVGSSFVVAFLFLAFFLIW